jgi:hypothetical protein
MRSLSAGTIDGSMLTERNPILPPSSLVILDQDAALTLARLHNVLLAHWRGPSDRRNGERLVHALRQLAIENPIGFVSLIEPTSEPPDKAQRVFLMRVISQLPVQAITTVIRGNALRRSFASVVLTGMLFLSSHELSTRMSFCASEGEAAAWIAKHLAYAPPELELTRALTCLRV